MGRISGAVLSFVLSCCVLGCTNMAATNGTPAGWIIDEDFSQGMDDWWVEGGEEAVVESGRLVVRADKPDLPGGRVCTVWCRTPHPADFELQLDAHVLKSSLDANNINLFLGFSDPSGRPLLETRDQRSSASYSLYHRLNGNIVTFLNDQGGEGGLRDDGSTKARVRIRHCPGFELLDETYRGHCRQGVTYHLMVVRQGGTVAFSVDGTEFLRATDAAPPGPGLFGLRTFATELWWDNVRLRPLAAQ